MRLRRTQWRQAPFRIGNFCADAAGASDLSIIVASGLRWTAADAARATDDVASQPASGASGKRSEVIGRR